MYVCICVCAVCICVCVCECVCTCVCRPEVDLRCPLISLGQALFLNMKPVDLARLTCQHAPVSPFPVLELQSCASVPGFSLECPGSELRSSLLVSKHFTN